MLFKDALSQLSRTVTVKLESLDCEVEIRKLTLREASNFEKLSENCKNDPVILTHEIGQKWITYEGQPLFSAEDRKVVEEMPVEQFTEIVKAFRSVNVREEAE